MSDNSRWEPFTKDIDAWNYLSLQTFPTVRGKGPEYRKPISIDEFLEGRDSTPKELIDLRTDFFNQKDKIRKSISVPFEGGRFVASPNTSIFRESDDPIIKYYFDNSEADAAAAADTQDLESIQSIYSTIGGVAAGLASAKPKPPNIVLKTNKGKVEIPVTENLGRDSANMNRMLTDILIKRTDKIIPKYSSGPIVQTNQGTMYRPAPGTMQSTFQSVNPNYDPIEGADELTERFRSQWQGKARTGDKTYYYDITGHRILDVPGMNDPAQQTRYKSWLTQSLINRKNQQLLNPQIPFTHFHSNQSFYDTQGMEWRLVRTDKSGRGPDQPYEPMPLNEIDSRKLKAENTSPEEKALLTELIKTGVKDRNSLERANPWLVEWNADTSGQNYHEHMIGLDESEFWNSGAGKAEGYMNNDVYNIEKGLGNVVVLRDPRFKLMKDLIADYITPRGKTEIYPGLKRRTEDVKKFTDGPYKGLNAVIGYEANPKSKEFTNLVIRAYNPDPNTNFSIVVSHIPNWYSNVYAKDLDTGNPVIPEEIANAFIRNYVDAVLSGNQPDIVKLEELGTHMFDSYGITKEIPAPGGLKQDTDFQNLGEYSTKSIDDDPLDLKTFKTTPKNQRRIDSYWKRQFVLWKEGRYKQLKLDLDKLFE